MSYQCRDTALDPDPWTGSPSKIQNVIICSLAHSQPSLKISCKSVWKFLRKVANRQTDKQTDKQRRLHNLLGGSNNGPSTRVLCVRMFTGRRQGLWSRVVKRCRCTPGNTAVLPWTRPCSRVVCSAPVCVPTLRHARTHAHTQACSLLCHWSIIAASITWCACLSRCFSLSQPWFFSFHNEKDLKIITMLMYYIICCNAKQNWESLQIQVHVVKLVIKVKRTKPNTLRRKIFPQVNA